MSEEVDTGVELVVMEDEQMRDEGGVIGAWEQSGPVVNQSTVMMTGDELTNGSIPVKEIGENGLGPIEDPINSLLGSLQLLQSSQSSEKDKMIPYVPPSEEIRVLQFEDTLSETDCRNFNFIYESLLLEGKAGNLMDLTVGMVLAEKPPAWPQVMHGRLKHLIINSEVFKKKKKAEYDARVSMKQLRTGKGKGIGKHSKVIRYLGASGKLKGKKPQRKIVKPKMTPLITKIALENDQLIMLITGICENYSLTA